MRTRMAENLVRIEGLQELQRKLLELPRKIAGRSMRSALMSGAKPIKVRARQLVPKDTGFLEEAIIQYPVKRSEHEYTDQVRVGVRKRVRKGAKLSKRYKAALGRARRRSSRQQSTTPKYWRYLEFGTSRMGARPFLRPAFEREKLGAAARIKQRMREGIEEAAKK